MHRAGRFDGLREIRALDPARDYHVIYERMALQEFPFDIRMGLLLAFWRTFAIPSVAELLLKTRETIDRTQRRADDTAILIYTLIQHGFEHPLGRAAIRRMNQLHRRFAITNDDYLYVLGTFIFTGLRWIDDHGWRPLCPQERVAAYHFYAELGRRMNIRSIPPDIDHYAAWFDQYERDHFAPTEAAALLMNATKALLADLPRPLVPLGQKIADALLDPPLRNAVNIKQPPWWASSALAGALHARALILRHFARPRRVPYLATGVPAKTYPDGYEIVCIGPTGS